jgi:acetyl CoA:N6-hydroxylysine acetyl transferase
VRPRNSTLAHRVFDGEIGGEISFRPATIEEDLERVHAWMNEPHVIPFWQMAWPVEKIERYLRDLLDDPHVTPYIGLLDGEPMSYWEAYRAADDVVATCYPAERDDQGVHLLIGPPEFVGKGYALPLLRAMVSFQFRHDATRRVVAEPDIRNERMIHVFERCAFEFQREIDLPDKRAALMFCHRESFERRFADAAGQR